jgi:sialic acid synthase SpsE
MASSLPAPTLTNHIEAEGIDLVKVASGSFADWPLLERAARVDKPIIASTADATPLPLPQRASRSPTLP